VKRSWLTLLVRSCWKPLKIQDVKSQPSLKFIKKAICEHLESLLIGIIIVLLISYNQIT
jgi:hypothetical protein